MSQAWVDSITEQDRDALPNRAKLEVRRSQRMPELDALRGLMLTLMTLAHLPTQAQVLTNQQLGFVSEAEGFVFLSAFLTGRIFGHIANESGFPTVLRRLWTRALRLYGYHLFLLGIAFTVVATVAIHAKRPGLEGLLDFYLAHPFHAVWSSTVLVYCPPLLDILPMYIIFLLATPIALYLGSWNWKLVLIPSGIIWLLAQFGLRTAIYARMVDFAGVRIPLNEMGAFDLLAWQFLWAVGLWIGSGSAGSSFKVLTSKISVIAALLVAAANFLLRHPLLHTQFDGLTWAAGFIDKWHLGALRLLDFSSLAILFVVSRSWLARWLTISPLVVLGKASLEVFCAHLLFCFVALSLVKDGTLPVWMQLALIAASFIGLYTVARLSLHSRFA
jgi:hypothetical protein